MAKSVQLKEDNVNILPISADHDENSVFKASKFADGTLIMYGNYSLTAAQNNMATQTFGLPISFVDTNYGISTNFNDYVDATANTPLQVICVGRTTSQVTIRLINRRTTGGNVTANINMILVGRWK